MILDEHLMHEKIQQDMERKKADKIIDMIMEDEDFKQLFFKKLNSLSMLSPT